MSITLYLPKDAASLALGADRVAKAIQRSAQARGLDVTLVRTGSRGMLWLEPLLEVETPEGRIAYGPVRRATSNPCSMPVWSRGERIACASAGPRTSPISPASSA